MASFSPKKYFSKIQSADVLVKYYATHDIQAFFEIGEQTPRKTAVDIMLDFYKSLSPEQKYDIERELALVESLSTKHAPEIISKTLVKHGITNHEKEIECKTVHDSVLYYYVYHNDLMDEILFVHDFYTAKGYMLYEAKEVSLDVAELAMTECTREFKRIANKEDRVTECEIDYQVLGDMLYVSGSFDGEHLLTPGRDAKTGEIDRKKTTRKLEQIRIIYLPKDKEVLISYTGGKQEKLIFLDTFLRIVCSSGYEDKEQSYDMGFAKISDFDFSKTNKGVPLLTWKIKSIALAFGEGKTKKKIRLSLPSSVQERGFAPLFSVIEEIHLEETFKSAAIENIALSFSFTDAQKPDKSVNVACTLSPTKCSLLPLFHYDRYARALLKQASIDKGFIEKAVKEKEEVTKKWER